MKDLEYWAQKHNISHSAMRDLSIALMGESVSKADPGLSESAVSQRVTLAASRKGIRLFRNNVGACEDTTGRFIRYGLANISKQMNSNVKSADLIGITPVVITNQHLGMMLGVFTSIECKRGGWTYSGNGREKAQNNWANVVRSLGGIAHFANSEQVIDEICTIQK